MGCSCGPYHAAKETLILKSGKVMMANGCDPAALGFKLEPRRLTSVMDHKSHSVHLCNCWEETILSSYHFKTMKTVSRMVDHWRIMVYPRKTVSEGWLEKPPVYLGQSKFRKRWPGCSVHSMGDCQVRCQFIPHRTPSTLGRCPDEDTTEWRDQGFPTPDFDSLKGKIILQQQHPGLH